MATNNAINSQNPIEAAKGGTGLATITDHCVLVGSGTDPITPLTALTDGQLVIGSTGLDPAVAALASAGSTITVTNGAGTIDLAVADGGETLVQQVYDQFTSLTTTTVNIPADNTKPQNDEGTEIVTLAITPTNSSNILEIEYISDVYHGARLGAVEMIALFQDATADALCVNVFERRASYTTSFATRVILKHRMVAGTASETTFKIRVGSASTHNVDTLVGAAKSFDGVNNSSLTIKEYEV